MHEFIVKYWVEALFGLVLAFLGWLYRKLAKRVKETRVKQTAIEEGMQALLRDRIIQAYNHYTDKGFCPIYGMENVESLYNAYHTLGGNGAITNIYNKLKQLPTEPPASN